MVGGISRYEKSAFFMIMTDNRLISHLGEVKSICNRESVKQHNGFQLPPSNHYGSSILILIRQKYTGAIALVSADWL